VNKWHLSRNGEVFGPYSFDQLREMAINGNLSKNDLIIEEGSSQWVKAGSVKKLFKKSKKKLLKFLIVIVILVAIGFGGYYYFNNRDSTNMVFGKSTELIKETVAPEEGKLIEVSSGELSGLKIEIPSSSYETTTDWKVEVSEIEEHDFGENFNPITPLISINNGGEYSNELIEVTIPIDLPEGYFATVFYYDKKTGELEGVPTISLSNNEIKIVTRHFSDIVPSIVPIEKVTKNIDIDTGFRPGYDDWQFVNRGSFIAEGGHCSGQSMSALWYYYEKKMIAGERGLYGRYDNNDKGYGTIDFWRDDSWGYRLSSVVQDDVDFGSWIAKAFLEMEGFNDTLTLANFAYSMLITGEPQFLGLAESGKPGGHAIIAHRVTNDGIYVSDPNYPGVERLIRFNNGTLGPYNSGADAQAIASGREVAYDEIGWYAKSALVSWNKVGTRFKELEDETIGNDLFPDIKLQVYVRDEGKDEDIWVSLSDNMEFASVDTAKVELYKSGQRYDMTGKIMVRTEPRYDDVYLKSYKGVNAISETKTTQEFGMEISLEEGINDIGLYTYHKNGNRENYINFERLNLILDEPIIEGIYEGLIYPEDAGVAIEFIIEKIVEWIAKAFDLDLSDADMDSIVEETEIDPVPVRITISNYDKDSGDCDINVYMIEDDGTEFSVDVSGKYKNNILKFDFRHYDGSKMYLEGNMNGEAFSGDFTVTAWGFLKDAITGRWKVDKLE